VPALHRLVRGNVERITWNMERETYNKKFIKEILREHNLRPNRKLGQSFLISRKAVEATIEAACLKPSDVVLEIGPGLGGLTFEIAKKAKKVVALEKDRGLVKVLKAFLEERGVENVEVVEGDVLNFQFSIFNLPRTARFARCNSFEIKQTISNFQFPNEEYKIIGNLPYNIAAAVVRRFLEAERPPCLMVVMSQKEVAQRICSGLKKGDEKMSKLGVFCQYYGQPEIVSFVSRNSFFPKPRVDSAILKIKPMPAERRPLNKKQEEVFRQIVKAGFSHKRKQLKNNLKQGLSLTPQQIGSWLQKNKIAPAARAEDLPIDDWLKLTKAYPQP